MLESLAETSTIFFHSHSLTQAATRRFYLKNAATNNSQVKYACHFSGYYDYNRFRIAESVVTIQRDQLVFTLVQIQKQSFSGVP